MSLDPQTVYSAADRWQKSKFIRPPTASTDPVIWVNEGDYLDMWHPAMRLDLQTAPHAWDQDMFDRTVSSLLPDAQVLVQKRIDELGTPAGFYGEYPKLVQDTLSRKG